jgi:hypothetical protein
LSPAITAYAAGQAITFKAANASTTASTLNVNTLGTKALKKKNDQDIASGDIEAAQIITAVYDGTSFQVTSQLGSEVSAGGSNTQVQYNSSGSLAGDGDLTFDGTNLTVANPLYLPDGAVATPAIANTGDLNSGIYFPAADTVGVTVGGEEQFRFGSNPIAGASKNLIHNGAMTVNQHGSTEVGGSSNIFNLDRFRSTWYALSSIAVSTVTKDSDSPKGFGSSMKFDVTTADSSFEGAYYLVRQDIEGQNCQHLNYGTADALTQTFSFWFKTTITGIYSAWLATRPTGLTYIREFTVESSDTWEFFQVTFPGYTGAVIADSTAAGLQLGITFGSNTLTGAVDQWQAGNDVGGSANQVNGVSSTSNNILTTGWLLEVGEIATSFPHEGYGTTLAKCQRYYYKIGPGADDDHYGPAFVASTTVCYAMVDFPVTMRANPTLGTTGVAADYKMRMGDDGNTDLTSVPSFNNPGVNGMSMNCTASSGPFTIGEGGMFNTSSASSYLSFSAEL